MPLNDLGSEMNIEKRLEQVRITTSMEEFLRKFYGLWYDDAESLASILGFQTEVEYNREQGDDPRQTHEEYMKEKVPGFEIITKAAKDGDYSGVTLGQYQALKSLVDNIAPSKPTLEEKVFGLLDKYFSGSKREIPVIKQFNDEAMEAIEPLYIIPDTVDGVGDTISMEDTRLLVKSVNEDKPRSSWFHKTFTDDFTITKAWINECECTIGDTLVPEGMPLAKVTFSSAKAYESRKSGKISGLSIGASAKFEDIE